MEEENFFGKVTVSEPNPERLSATESYVLTRAGTVVPVEEHAARGRQLEVLLLAGRHVERADALLDGEVVVEPDVALRVRV